MFKSKKINDEQLTQVTGGAILLNDLECHCCGEKFSTVIPDDHGLSLILINDFERLKRIKRNQIYCKNCQKHHKVKIWFKELLGC